MIVASRTARSLALRGKARSGLTLPPADHPPLAKATNALLPLRAAPLVFISSTSAKPATAVTKSGDVTGTAAPMSVTGKERREVPLPSQEGKKGVMEYAL